MNFYYSLRSKNAKRPTTIYAIITNEGKQWKIATDCKILPSLWDGQKAIISNYNNEETNQANLLINVKLNDLNLAFQKKVCTFALHQTSFDNVINELKINTMTKNKENVFTSATALLNQAFNELAEVRNWKDGSHKKNYSMLTHILEYVKAQTKNKPSNINLDLTDGYFRSIQGKAPQTIKDRMCLLLNLINDILSVETKYKRYGVKPIAKKYKVTDNRGEEEKKSCALNQEQVQAIKDVELKGVDNTIRNLFILDTMIGQRWSDWGEVINTIDINSKDGLWTYTPTKENKKFIKATIRITDDIKAIINTLREDENLNEVLKYKTDDVNKRLRTIAKKANLTTPYTYYRAKGNNTEKVVTTLDKVITSHWGRHTFITNRLLEGYSPIEVSKMSGHADSTMIEKVYSHNKEEIAKRILLNASERIGQSKEESTNRVDEYKRVLAMFNVPSTEWIEETDQEELFRIVLIHETEFADKLGWGYKQIKDLFNDETKTLKEKREILQKALNN